MNEEHINREAEAWQLYNESEQSRKEVFDIEKEHKDTFRQESDSLQATKSESQEISEILGDQTISLDEEVRLSLEARQGRNLSHILINSKKFLGDSKEMKEVKLALRDLEAILALERNDDTVISQLEIEIVESKYRAAIERCNYYLSVKTTHTRSDRNNMVRERLKGLVDEYGRISEMKAILADNPEAEFGKVRCPYELLLGSRLLSIHQDERVIISSKPDTTMKRDGKALKAFKEDKKGLQAQDTATKEIINILTLTQKPSEFVGSQGDDACQIAQGVFNMLKAFPDGICVKYIHSGLFMNNGKRKWVNAEGKEVFCDTVIGLMQDKSGNLTVTIGDKTFELPYGRMAILGRMEDNMLANESKFDTQFIKDELSWIRDADLDEQSTVEIRNTCLKFIERRTDIKATEFNNMTTDAVRAMAVQLLDGKIDAEGIRDCIEFSENYALTTDADGNDTLVSGSTTSRMVNGGETMEILRYRERRINEIREELMANIGPNLMVDLKKQLLKERMDAFKGERIVKVEAKAKRMGRLTEWIMGKAEDLAMTVVDSLIKKTIGEQAFNELMAAVEREVDKEVNDEIQRRIRAEIKEVKFAVPNEVQAPQVTEANHWSPEEEGIKNLVADIIFSKDTWKEDETVEAPGVRIERLLYDNSKLLAAIVKDPDIIIKMIDKLPLPGMQDELKNDFRGLIDELSVNKRVADIVQKNATEDLINLVIKSALSISTVREKLAAIENDINQMISENIPDVQETIDECVNVLFPTRTAEQTEEGQTTQTEEGQTAQHEEVIGDPNQVGISAEDRQRRIDAGNARLQSMLEDSVSGDSGQARFLKNVFRKYFTNVPLMDQRAMLASAIRDVTPVSANVGRLGSLETLTDDQKLYVAGKYLGGIFKGAGPLMQKILQGLPIESIPKELRGAFEDVKSNLLPIPDEIVEAQLMSMVERSKGEITKIEVVKVLGAASVGQAFLCKMYGPSIPDEGKNAVVKLLRPNARNRMMREKAIMLECAEETNDGMKKTYEGQLERIEAELDLSIEAENVEKGQIYSKGSETDHVAAMKLDPLIAPTVNSMVVECAPGQTVDKYLKETEIEYKSMLAPVMGSQKINGVDVPAIAAYEKSCNTVKKARVAITAKLAELQKRQKYLISLSKKWVEEGLFGEGFYHGDLHAGNIMIDDNGATVIDFGNATQLQPEQKEIVTQMMAAAVVGDVKLFRDGYHALMKKDQETEDHFNSVVGRFDEELSKILKLGDTGSSGQRIGVALLKAQELGLELPAAIYNFSQCQLRLQNTIESINRQIITMQNDLKEIQIPNPAVLTARDASGAVDILNKFHPEFCVKNYTAMMDTFGAAMSKEELLDKIYNMDPAEFEKYYLWEGKFEEKSRENNGFRDFYTSLMDCYEHDMSALAITNRMAGFTAPGNPFQDNVNAFKAVIGEQNFTRLTELLQNPIEKKPEILEILSHYKPLPELIQELRDMKASGTADPAVLSEKEAMIHSAFVSYMKADVPDTQLTFEKSNIKAILKKFTTYISNDIITVSAVRTRYDFLANDPATSALFNDCMAKKAAHLADKTNPDLLEEFKESIRKLNVPYNEYMVKKLYDERKAYMAQNADWNAPYNEIIGTETKVSMKKPMDFLDVMGDVLGKYTKQTIKRLGIRFMFTYRKELEGLG